MSENETFKDGPENERADRTGAKLRGVGSTAGSMPVQMARPLGLPGKRALSPFLPTGFQNLLWSPAAWFTDCLTHKALFQGTLWVQSCRREAESALDAACWVSEVGARLSGVEKPRSHVTGRSTPGTRRFVLRRSVPAALSLPVDRCALVLSSRSCGSVPTSREATAPISHPAAAD